MNILNYIGTALEYPLSVRSGSAAIITGEASIEASLLQILNTYRGSLPHNPYFGSNLFRLIFEPVTAVAISAGSTYIVEAIKEWERRIQITAITGDSSRRAIDGVTVNVIDFSITYRLVATNETKTFVYPFYRELKF